MVKLSDMKMSSIDADQSRSANAASAPHSTMSNDAQMPQKRCSSRSTATQTTTPNGPVLLFLFFLLFIHVVHASSPPLHRPAALAAAATAASSSSSSHLRVPVGALLQLPAAGDDVDEAALPSWCRLDRKAHTLFGIPQLRDVGHRVIFIRDLHVDVSVGEEVSGRCGEEETTTSWVEVIDDRLLEETPLVDQLAAVRELVSSTPSLAPKNQQIKQSATAAQPFGEWRVFPAGYLDRYRTVQSMMDEQLDAAPKPEQMVFVLPIACGELSEFANEVINALVEQGRNFRVVEGVLNAKRTPLLVGDDNRIDDDRGTPTVTFGPDLLDRTTRRVHHHPHQSSELDQRPVVVSPLKMFTCQKGFLCRVPIPLNTFVDAEDGTTERLSLAVFPLLDDDEKRSKVEDEAPKNGSSWLTVVVAADQPGGTLLPRLEGVPLEILNSLGQPKQAQMQNGDSFRFRLEARDRAGQAVSTPFQVLVQTVPREPNHAFAMLLDTPLERFRAQPADWLAGFISTLAYALKKNELSEDGSLASWTQEIRVLQVSPETMENGGGGGGGSDGGEVNLQRTVVRWTNQTLAVQRRCPQRELNETRAQMIYEPSGRVRLEFTRAMSARFHVRKVWTELRGSCQPKEQKRNGTISIDGMRIRATTTERTVMTSSAGDRDQVARAGGGDSWLKRVLDRMTGSPLLVPGILSLVIIILLALLVLLCMTTSAVGGRTYKFRRYNNEFTTKGRPVVFPEEIQGGGSSDDDSGSGNCSMATVTTPMVLEREQPPMSLADRAAMMMTLHENPLYRPPPQVQATLLKTPPPTFADYNGGSGGGGGTSTFSPTSHSHSSSNSSPLRPIDASPHSRGPSLGQYYHQQQHPPHVPRTVGGTGLLGQRQPPPYASISGGTGGGY